MLKFMREHIKSIMITVIALFVISCFAGYGLYSRSSANKGGNSQRDRAVAEVNGKEVMLSRLEQGVGRLTEQYQAQQQKVVSTDTPYLRRQVLDSIALADEMDKEIESRDIKISKNDIEAAFNRVMEQYATREEFKNSLQRQGITEKEVKKEIEKQLAQQKVTDSIAAAVKVKDSDVRSFYNSAKNFIYKQPAGIETLVATFNSKIAADLALKSLQGGADWDKIMDEHKNDLVSAATKAKPVLVTPDMTKEGALAKIKELPLKKFSAVVPIEGSTNCYIAYKLKKMPERVLSYNEVSADVKSLMTRQETQMKQNEFYRSLVDRATIKILDKTLFPEEKPASADVSSDKSAGKSTDKAD